MNTLPSADACCNKVALIEQSGGVAVATAFYPVSETNRIRGERVYLYTSCNPGQQHQSAQQDAQQDAACGANERFIYREPSRNDPDKSFWVITQSGRKKRPLW